MPHPPCVLQHSTKSPFTWANSSVSLAFTQIPFNWLPSVMALSLMLCPVAIDSSEDCLCASHRQEVMGLHSRANDLLASLNCWRSWRSRRTVRGLVSGPRSGQGSLQAIRVPLRGQDTAADRRWLSHNTADISRFVDEAVGRRTGTKQCRVTGNKK